MSDLSALENTIESVWEAGDDANLAEASSDIERVIELLDQGYLRCAEPVD